MTPILVALAAALVYGISDFLGGVLSRRSHFAPIIVAGTLAGVVVTALVLSITRPGVPPLPAALWCLGAGICNGIGGLALYRGMAGGAMAIVAPISAVGSAALPALVGIAGGERVSILTGIGLILALPAIWLLAGGTTRFDSAVLGRGAVDGLVAGAGFGGLFIGIGQGDGAPGIWPVALSQVGALIPGLLSLVVLRRAWRGRVARGEVRLAPIPGLLAATAILLYQVSLTSGSVTVSSVITSLYPGFTVLLATWFLQEHLTLLQRCGLGLAASAVVATALG